MNEADFRALVSGEKRGVVAALARVGLRGLSLGYRAAVCLRNRLFDWGMKGIHQADVPVVSVGNITTGGTGKTPLVAFLVNWFREQSVKPTILSRGYRAAEGGANDEKLVLDQLCPGVPHLQNPDRVASARQAVTEHQAQVLVLDDGFQHRRLGRNLDVVLIDATCPWGYGAVLPRGLLREPLSSLRRADFAILTRADQVNEAERDQILNTIEKQHPSLPVGQVAFVPIRLVNSRGETRSFADVQGQSATAFCGIGNPRGFLQTLCRFGISIEESQLIPFADHHHYAKPDFDSILEQAKRNRTEVLLTTQKDLVKIPQTHLGDVPLWAVEIGAEWLMGEAELAARLNRLVDGLQASS